MADQEAGVAEQAMEQAAQMISERMSSGVLGTIVDKLGLTEKLDQVRTDVIGPADGASSLSGALEGLRGGQEPDPSHGSSLSALLDAARLDLDGPASADLPTLDGLVGEPESGSITERISQAADALKVSAHDLGSKGAQESDHDAVG